MKRIITLVLLLVVGSPILADEKKLAPAKQPVKEQAKEEEPPAPKTLDEAHEQLEKLLPKEEIAKIDAHGRRGWTTAGAALSAMLSVTLTSHPASLLIPAPAVPALER